MLRSTIHKNEAGFTVLEIVISIVVAGIFIIGMSSAVSNLNTANTRAENLSVANAFAESKVEELRNAKFVALPPNGTAVDFTDELPQRLPEPRSASYLVTDLSAATKQINVTLEYNDFGSSRELTYSTVIGELGVGQY